MHSALDHGIGRFGVHDIQDRMNHLIAFDAESHAPRIVFVSASIRIFMNPWSRLSLPPGQPASSSVFQAKLCALTFLLRLRSSWLLRAADRCSAGTRGCA